MSAIASKLWKPVFADEATSNASYLDFARICIDMKAGSGFPTHFDVIYEEGERFNIRV